MSTMSRGNLTTLSDRKGCFHSWANNELFTAVVDLPFQVLHNLGYKLFSLSAVALECNRMLCWRIFILFLVTWMDCLIRLGKNHLIIASFN